MARIPKASLDGRRERRCREHRLEPALDERAVQNKTAGPRRRAGDFGKKLDSGRGLRVRLGLAEADHAIAFLPLATTLENFHSLEALENVALRRDGAGSFETAMLGHKICGKEARKLAVLPHCASVNSRETTQKAGAEKSPKPFCGSIDRTWKANASPHRWGVCVVGEPAPHSVPHPDTIGCGPRAPAFLAVPVVLFFRNSPSAARTTRGAFARPIRRRRPMILLSGNKLAPRDFAFYIFPSNSNDIFSCFPARNR